jgi:hypothetical protein
VNKEQEFDRQLKQLKQHRQPAPEYLASRILANLPERGPAEMIFSWFGASAWRGATAAMLPLILGMAFGIISTAEQEPWYESQTLVFADTIEEYDYDEI